MTKGFWFKPRKSMLDFGRPANWKGWASLLVFIFLFALVSQAIGAWAFSGFTPLTAGVWLFALMFLLIGIFLKVCNANTPPSENS